MAMSSGSTIEYLQLIFNDIIQRKCRYVVIMCPIDSFISKIV